MKRASTVPGREAMALLLAEYAPLSPVLLCPEISAYRAHVLIDVWEAAERLAGETLPAPFWAYPWAGGCALARVLLDRPDLVRGASVLDFGAGGGVTAVAAAFADAGRTTVNDIDPWSLLVATMAAEAQGLQLHTLQDDICQKPALVDHFDVVLCGDLAYERSQAPLQRAVLDRAARNGAVVLVADAGRTYFETGGMQLLAEYEVDVPVDLEGGPRRTARCYRYEG